MDRGRRRIFCHTWKGREGRVQLRSAFWGDGAMMRRDCEGEIRDQGSFFCHVVFLAQLRV